MNEVRLVNCERFTIMLWKVILTYTPRVVVNNMVVLFRNNCSKHHTVAFKSSKIQTFEPGIWMRRNLMCSNNRQVEKTLWKGQEAEWRYQKRFPPIPHHGFLELAIFCTFKPLKVINTFLLWFNKLEKKGCRGKWDMVGLVLYLYISLYSYSSWINVMRILDNIRG